MNPKQITTISKSIGVSILLAIALLSPTTSHADDEGMGLRENLRTVQPEGFSEEDNGATIVLDQHHFMNVNFMDGQNNHPNDTWECSYSRPGIVYYDVDLSTLLFDSTYEPTLLPPPPKDYNPKYVIRKTLYSQSIGYSITPCQLSWVFTAAAPGTTTITFSHIPAPNAAPDKFVTFTVVVPAEQE